jgi:aminopeptidase-like protein
LPVTSELIAAVDHAAVDTAVPSQIEAGRWMHDFIAELYPICRSITGAGVRETLALVARRLPLAMTEVPSGTVAFDWTVPPEWNIRDAYIATTDGQRVVDFRNSNLHVVGYSVPIRARIAWTTLQRHLFTLPDRPDWIPYRTSYYARTWGFCVSQRQYDGLTDKEYDVCIDATLADGSLTYGECLIPGSSDEEVLIWCHACHPSLCNDNLSGVALVTALGRHLSSAPRRHSYRIVLAPGTIGAVTWLSRNAESVRRIRHGVVVTCVGDAGPFTYKRSRRGNAVVDRVMAHVLRHSGADYEIQDFNPYGYDERQFCSPGFNLPVGCFMRTPHGRFPEYHTSADNLAFVQPQALADSFALCARAIDVLEGDRTYVNQNPDCEPQLGKRGLYEGLGASSDQRAIEMAMLWVLNQSDGAQSLLDIATRSDTPFAVVRTAADRLIAHDMLRETTSPKAAAT